MILIVESGSTKTSWAILGKTVQQWQTAGINPYQQNEAEIIHQIQRDFSFDPNIIQHLFFYGAGATEDGKLKLSNSLKVVFKNTQLIDIQSDMYAAAYALCQDKAGIVCILGTGSNSCVYDGKKIIDNIGGFGFVLGDEGSGGVLGRTLINDFLHRNIPNDLSQKLQFEYQLSTESILKAVYRSSFPNRFLANFVPFLHRHRTETYVQNLLAEQFHLFFKKKVLCYDSAKALSLHFTGSIAYFFEKELRKAATEIGLKVETVAQNPMGGLIVFHQKSN